MGNMVIKPHILRKEDYAACVHTEPQKVRDCVLPALVGRPQSIITYPIRFPLDVSTL